LAHSKIKIFEEEAKARINVKEFAFTFTALNKIDVQKPDLEEIRARVNNPDDRYYYPKLRKLYNRHDTVMTPEEYRYYYLGYLFQEDFNPYRISEFSSVTDSLSYLAKHTKQECDTIIKYAELSLDDNPFDLKQMSFLIYALIEKHKDMLAMIWQYRLENILGAIISTGTGEDVDNAWYVISPAHEYALINAMNFTATGYNEVASGIVYIAIERADSKACHRSDKTPEGFFFNIKNLQEEYNRKFPDETGYDDATVREEIQAKQPALLKRRWRQKSLERK
jgi:hypothetical protein